MDWSKKRINRISEFESFSDKKFSNISNYIILLKLKDYGDIVRKEFNGVFDQNFDTAMVNTVRDLFLRDYVSNFAWTNLSTIAFWYGVTSHKSNIFNLLTSMASEASVNFTRRYGLDKHRSCIFTASASIIPTKEDGVLYYMRLRDMAYKSVLQRMAKHIIKEKKPNSTREELHKSSSGLSVKELRRFLHDNGEPLKDIKDESFYGLNFYYDTTKERVGDSNEEKYKKRNVLKIEPGPNSEIQHIEYLNAILGKA